MKRGIPNVIPYFKADLPNKQRKEAASEAKINEQKEDTAAISSGEGEKEEEPILDSENAEGTASLPEVIPEWIQKVTEPTDVVLVAEKKRVAAHKNILSTCPYFEGMFCFGMKEATQVRVFQLA